MEHKVSQNLSQYQIFSTNQIQSLDILSLSNIELDLYVSRKIVENPVLDFDYNSTFSKRVLSLDDDNNNFLTGELAHKQSFIDFILKQIKVFDVTEDIVKAAQKIIENLDESGFLIDNLNTIFKNSYISNISQKKALELVQSLEPIGLASKNIQECLLVQLKKNKLEKSLIYKIIDKYFIELKENKIPFISQQLRVSNQDIYHAIKIMKEYHLYPAKTYHKQGVSYIYPDVFIHLDENKKLVASFYSNKFNSISISSEYQEMLKNNNDKKIKQFIDKKIKEGKDLISYIDKRKETFLKVINWVMYYQYDFFISKILNPKPLTMETIAESIQVHSSTITRTVQNKYLDTPRGKIPFKYLFINSNQAKENNSDQLNIKDKISLLIGQENKQKPLSDDDIANLLKKSSIYISRRTVSKYRESLNIPKSQLRKRYL